MDGELFASLQDLKDRWPDLPAGADTHAAVLLEDAHQFILDLGADTRYASPNSLRRITCAVVRRAMEADGASLNGVESMQVAAGPFQFSGKASNPHGDLYLTRMEKRALGIGRQRAGEVNMLAHLAEDG